MSMQTPQLSDHARERCTEMGISTKIAKRVWQHRSVSREHGHRMLVTSTAYPDYVVVVADYDTDPIIVTVLRHCDEWTEER